MSNLDLTKFCRTDGPVIHYDLSAPFVKDGWRYATDGIICIRISAPDEPNTLPPTKVKFPPVETLFWRDGERVAWPKHDGKTQEDWCETCDGGGHTVKCYDCDHYDVDGLCLGDGGEACPHPVCHDCNGTCQRLYPANQNVSGAWIAAHFFELIASLPSPFFVNDVNPDRPVAIHFDGGQVIVMPTADAPK